MQMSHDTHRLLARRKPIQAIVAVLNWFTLSLACCQTRKEHVYARVRAQTHATMAAAASACDAIVVSDTDAPAIAAEPTVEGIDNDDADQHHNEHADDDADAEPTCKRAKLAAISLPTVRMPRDALTWRIVADGVQALVAPAEDNGVDTAAAAAAEPSTLIIEHAEDYEGWLVVANADITDEQLKLLDVYSPNVNANRSQFKAADALLETLRERCSVDMETFLVVRTNITRIVMIQPYL
jgi:hypothetical protein